MRAPFAIALTLVYTQALSAEQPLDFPTRDVAVTYRISDGTKGYTWESVYSALERKQRDNTGAHLPAPQRFYVIIDHKAKISLMVFPGPPPRYSVMGYPPSLATMSYQKTRRKERIAGYECDVWETPMKEQPYPAAGQPGVPASFKSRASMCVTPDGVQLKTHSETITEGLSHHMVVEAVKVTFGPIDPLMVRLPAGATRN